MPLDAVAPGKAGERDGPEERPEVTQRDVDTPKEVRDPGVSAAERPGTQLGEQNRADVFELLDRYGFEPRHEDDAIVLADCPFHALARERTRTVCGMNLRLLHGVLKGIDETGIEARLVPGPGSGRCRVRLQSAAEET
ncbi:hypothetical protein [Streptomyces sp. NRRL B-24572]|uniref:hypothetical protein n=1 Tax=Streptomyces sp. NRRL B-24572 TaxID=1962156 RepID=UPI000A361DF0|nr:hypothetical protein [Streptomyces sp. NRRL B-24572]